MWLVDGLADGGCALVVKLHHALVDGVAGVRLIEAMLRPTRSREIPERLGWTPTPPPRGPDLVRAELAHRARAFRDLLRPGNARDAALVAAGLGSLLVRGLTPAPDAGINPWPAHRARRFAGLDQPLARVHAAGERHGATVNDVVLALAAGGLKALLEGRGVDTAGLRGFRAMVPVNARRKGEGGTAGNRVVLLLVPLPVDEADPVRRLERVRDATRRMKHGSRDVDAGGLLLRLGEATTPRLVSGVLGLTLRRRAFNVVVTDIPGPQHPLYLLGARLTAFYPAVNVWPGETLAIGQFSYDGTLFWGFSADAEAVPDLDVLVAGVAEEFRALAPPRRRRAARTGDATRAP
jgi:WS/DGAT/MGAT family acyltransferase